MNNISVFSAIDATAVFDIIVFRNRNFIFKLGWRIKMKIAALILAYNYPLGLSALARLFSAVDIDTFIHVDEKIDIFPFQEFGGPNVIFIPRRKRIFWRGFTMIEATIELICAAMENNKYDRYIIISDDSLPIVEMQEFRRRIELNVDYIDLSIVPPIFQSRYENFYMFDSEATQVRWLPVVDREFSDDALMRIERLKALRKIGKKPIPTVFYGSQWMSLTASSVQCILESWNEDHWLRESFEFSEVPDEGYFHTILAQNLHLPSRPLMHVEWSGNPPPARVHDDRRACFDQIQQYFICS